MPSGCVRGTLIASIAVRVNLSIMDPRDFQDQQKLEEGFDLDDSIGRGIPEMSKRLLFQV